MGMHTRRLVTFLLGAWIFGTGFMTYVAIHNLRQVDHYLEFSPPKSKIMLAGLGQDNARMLLRSQASRLNRDYFRRWEEVELALGAACIFCLAFTTERRWLPLAFATMAFLLVGFLHLFISPEIDFLGDALDFAAPNAAEGQRMRMWLLHQVYTVATLVKLGLCGALTAFLLWFRPARRVSRQRRISDLDASDDVTLSTRVS